MKNIKNSHKLFITALLALVAIIFLTVIFSKKLYTDTRDLMIANFKERILAISLITASQIEPNDIEVLQTKSDWKKIEWERVVNTLHGAKYSNSDVVFMYIFRKDKNSSGEMVFVADADSINPFAHVDVNRDGRIEINGPDKLQWPGQPYPEANEIPETLLAYNGPTVSKQLYTDKYGTVISAYAPIKNNKGEIIAILATDVKADDFLRVANQALVPFIIFASSLILVISILVTFVIILWKQYSNSLERLNEERLEFISIATHHIFSPLTVLKGYASMLSDDKNDLNTIKLINESINKLIHVLRAFIYIYRNDNEKRLYNFKTTNIISVIHEICNEFRSQCQFNSIIFNSHISDVNALVNIDEQSIREAFNIILKNSLRFTTSGYINISAEVVSEQIVVNVVDSGIRKLPDVSKILLKKFSDRNNQFEANLFCWDLSLYFAKIIFRENNGFFDINERVNSLTNRKETMFSLRLILK